LRVELFLLITSTHRVGKTVWSGTGLIATRELDEENDEDDHHQPGC